MSVKFNCPKLADKSPLLVTIHNAAQFKLTSYERSPGTKVNISCLGEPEYIVIGPSSLTCQPNGNWDNTIPRCVSKRSLLTTPITTTAADPITPTDTDISMLPIIFGASLLAFVFVVLVILIAFTAKYWKIVKSPPTDESTSTNRNSQLRQKYPMPRTSEYSMYSSPNSVINNFGQYTEWDSASVEFNNELGDNYDYIYNGSTVTAVNRPIDKYRLSPWSSNLPQTDVMSMKTFS